MLTLTRTNRKCLKWSKEDQNRMASGFREWHTTFGEAQPLMTTPTTYSGK
jgi:hypothetical protein